METTLSLTTVLFTGIVGSTWLTGVAHPGRSSRCASYHLGKAYEAMNEHEKSWEDYPFFAEGWRESDPELEPMVQEARQAAMRLERE